MLNGVSQLLLTYMLSSAGYSDGGKEVNKYFICQYILIGFGIGLSERGGLGRVDYWTLQPLSYIFIALYF